GLPNFADPHTDNGGYILGGGGGAQSAHSPNANHTRPRFAPGWVGACRSVVGPARGRARRRGPPRGAGVHVPPGPSPARGRPRGGGVLAGAAAVVAAAGVAVAVAGPFAGAGHAGGGAAASGYPTSLSAIARRLLQSQTSVSATLGYAGSYTVTGHGGTLTWLPAAGRVIRQGQILYRVGNGTPVFLLYGRVPAWRALSAGGHGAHGPPRHPAPGAPRYPTP